MPRSAVEVRKIIHKTIILLTEHIKIKAAYLFGSYAQGKPHENSDIDLVFFSPSVAKMDLDEKITMLSEIQEEVGADVEMHVFSEECLKEARPTNFYGYILKTGKKIL